MTPLTLKGRGTANKFFVKLLVSEYFVIVLSIVYFLIISIFVPSMLSGNNIKNIFSNMWPLFAVAIGQTFVLLLGGIDLSQTSTMALTSVIGALLISNRMNPDILSNSPLWGVIISENGGPLGKAPIVLSVSITIAVMILVGTLVGAINGILISKVNMPPFMVTLIAQMFYSAIAIYLTKSQNVIGLPDAFCAIGGKSFGFIPYSFFITIILGVIAHFLLSKTIRGRWIYATGSNIKAARVSGVPTISTTIFVYAASGFFAAVGALLYTGRLMMGRPTLGDGQLMDILGATVIGGTSMTGGKGKVSWTLFGVLFYTIITTSLSQLKLDSFVINVVKGLVILGAVTLDVARTRIQQKGTLSANAKSGKKVTLNG